MSDASEESLLWAKGEFQNKQGVLSNIKQTKTKSDGDEDENAEAMAMKTCYNLSWSYHYHTAII